MTTIDLDVEHDVTIDETTEGRDRAYKAFCTCGWSEDRWHHADTEPDFEQDPIAAAGSAEIAADDAADVHRDEVNRAQREHADRVTSIEGTITLADGTTSSFSITADGGYQQWGAAQERLSRTVDVLSALVEGLVDGEVRFEGEDEDE